MSYTVVVVVVVMVVCIDLWEIDKKKQCRAELTELERREHLLRRKELYEKKWPPSGREIRLMLYRQSNAISAVALSPNRGVQAGCGLGEGAGREPGRQFARASVHAPAALCRL